MGLWVPAKSSNSMRHYTLCARCAFSLCLFFALAVGSTWACTTAVVSARASKSGRAMLWKLRDTDSLRNRVKFFADGRYAYIGLVNCDSSAQRMVWAGCNAAGFAIMNSASFNTNPGDTTKFADQEGIVMKQALMQCRTLADFEAFLLARPRPWGLNANFGVVDAEGGAAYYETDNYHFVKYDVNDPAVAPKGYLVRTNFSEMGTPNVGYGFIRRQTAEGILAQAASQGKLSLELFTDRLPHDLSNALTGDSYNQTLPTKAAGYMVNASDFICRYGSASNAVIESVGPGEAPSRTTLWCAIAFPLTCVHVPAWPLDAATLPQQITSPSDGLEAPLGHAALQLMRRVYPITRGSGLRYMDLAVYRNSLNGGLEPQRKALDGQIRTKALEMMAQWGAASPDRKHLHAFNAWLDQALARGYRAMLGSHD